MKKNKRILLILLILLAIPSISLADVGPKPSVSLDFSGLSSNYTYYVTLLSKSTYGPWDEFQIQNTEDMSDDQKYDYQMEIRLDEYETYDDYRYIGYYEKLEGEDSFSWSYYPPENFRILIYFDQTGKYIISNEITRFAFYSSYKIDLENIDLSNQNKINLSPSSIKKAPQYETLFNSFLFTFSGIILTLLIEGIFALIIGYRDKNSLKVIAITNILTQLVLALILSVLNYKYGFLSYIFSLILLEILIIIIEPLVYRKKLERRKAKLSPVMYGVLANIFSFLIGLALVALGVI